MLEDLFVTTMVCTYKRVNALCLRAGGYCGECVSFYKICTGDRRTTGQWVRGQKVRGASLPVGTGIATFPNGKYYGHAAIYMGQNAQGTQAVFFLSTNFRPIQAFALRF